MHDLVVIGATYRTLPIDHLAGLIIPRAEVPRRLPALAAALGVRHLVYLGTCNRAEFIVQRPPDADAHDLRARAHAALRGATSTRHEAERSFRVWSGTAAIEHLMSIACGLDSARVGDREIATQLRDAWRMAQRAGLSGARLDEACAAALAAAHDALHRHAMPDAQRSLAQRAVDHVVPWCADRPAGRVALVGVSPMTRAAGRALARANLELLVVNRSAMPRNRLAREIGARPVAWERFFAGDHPVDALVTAVGTVEHVADGPTLSRLGPAVPGRHLLVVDLGVPANIGEQAAAAAGARFVGMDSLIADAAAERPDALLGTARIRAILEQHLTRVLRRSATRAAGPLIGALRDQFESRVDQEIECLLRSDLPHLDDAQREALRVWGGRLAHRMAHVPLQGLRSLAAAGELDRVEECVHAMQRALEGRAEERT